MSHTITTKIAIGIIIGACASLVFLAVPNYSNAHGADHATTATSTKKMKGKNVDATCMQTAVDTREAALGTAWVTLHDEIEDALTARKTALHDAWGLTDVQARNTAIGKAWKTWKTDSKNIQKEFRTDRKASWETFRKTTKDSCKVTAPKDEALGTEAKGEITL
jgi:hypothetical protein